MLAPLRNQHGQECRRHQGGDGQHGFTLLELIMIMVVIAIVLPLALMPFTQAAKGIGTPIVATNIAAFARKNMERTLACVDVTAPPAADCTALGYGTGGWPAASFGPLTVTDVQGGKTYTTTITGTLGTMAPGTTTFTAGAGNYLLVSVTTSTPEGSTHTLQSLKVANL